MDTKARVAVIVGGVVLVGMVAWVLMPSGKTEAPADTDQPLVDSTDAPVSPVDQFAGLPSTQPATQPFAGVDPFASPTTLPSTTVDIGPSLTPADSTDAWSRALDGNGPAAAGQTAARTPANDGFSTNYTTHSGFDTTTTTTTVIPAEPLAAGTPKTYTIASGDSLYTVSEKIYGSSKYVNKIVAANPGVDPKRLKVGQTIKLPDVSATASSETSTVSAPTASASTSTPNSYKVQSGDSLRKIATKVYGDAGKWERIYSANKSLIGSDPSRLRAGMVLKVPAN
jgi:nucleoid-associated protein YgaU